MSGSTNCEHKVLDFNIQEYEVLLLPSLMYWREIMVLREKENRVICEIKCIGKRWSNSVNECFTKKAWMWGRQGEWCMT